VNFDGDLDGASDRHERRYQQGWFARAIANRVGGLSRQLRNELAEFINERIVKVLLDPSFEGSRRNLSAVSVRL
jgi:hypothetical protein